MWRKDFEVQYRKWEFMLQCVEMALVHFVADAYRMAEMAFKLLFSLFSQEITLKGEIIPFVVITEIVASCRWLCQYPIFPG